MSAAAKEKVDASLVAPKLVQGFIKDGYELGEQIGQGSYGHAYLAVRKLDSEVVVVKRIRVAELSQKEKLEAVQEVKVLSQFDHVNIIRYHECIAEEGMLNIVMEYAHHGELAGMIQERSALKRPFNEDEIMFWFVQIVLALWHVHNKNVLHRDLKSQNIFLAQGNMIKLGDFGIARVLNSNTELVKTAIGTPYYLSPEICEDKPYNHKSDVWALGCVLYELCTLKRAFDGQSLPALVVKILRGKYPPIPARYGPSLKALVDSMLKQRPKDRPSMEDMLKLEYVKQHLQRYANHVASLFQGQQLNLGVQVVPPKAARLPSATRIKRVVNSAGKRITQSERVSKLSSAKSAHTIAAPALPGLELADIATIQPGAPSSQAGVAGNSASEEAEIHTTSASLGTEDTADIPDCTTHHSSDSEDTTKERVAQTAEPVAADNYADSDSDEVYDDDDFDSLDEDDEQRIGSETGEADEVDGATEDTAAGANSDFTLAPDEVAGGESCSPSVSSPQRPPLPGHGTWLAKQQANLEAMQASFLQRGPLRRVSSGRGDAGSVQSSNTDENLNPFTIPQDKSPSSSKQHVERSDLSASPSVEQNDLSPSTSNHQVGTAIASATGLPPRRPVSRQSSDGHLPVPTAGAHVMNLQLKLQKDPELEANKKHVNRERARRQTAAQRKVKAPITEAEYQRKERHKMMAKLAEAAKAEELRRVKRAAILEKQIKEKEVSKKKMEEEIQQHMASHKNQLKAARARVSKSDLAKLGAEFASKMQQPSTNAQVIVMEFEDDSGTSSVPSFCDDLTPSSSPSMTQVAEPLLLGNSRHGRTPSVEEDKDATARTTAPPWKVAGRRSKGASDFPPVEIFCPFGSDMTTDATSSHPAELMSTIPSRPVPETNPRNGADHNKAGTLVESLQLWALDRVLSQIQELLTPPSSTLADQPSATSSGQALSGQAQLDSSSFQASKYVTQGGPAKVEQLRMMLENELGPDEFFNAYRFLKQVQDNDETEDEESTQIQLENLLGSKLHLARYINNLIMLEDSIFQ